MSWRELSYENDCQWDSQEFKSGKLCIGKVKMYFQSMRHILETKQGTVKREAKKFRERSAQA